MTTRLMVKCACREIDITKYEGLCREAEGVGLFCGRCKTIMVARREQGEFVARRNPYCSQNENEPPRKQGDRVSVNMTTLHSDKRWNGTVTSVRWNGEDSDTGWWVDVELDEDPGPAGIADRPRIGRKVTVMAAECQNAPPKLVGRQVDLLQTLPATDGNGKPNDLPPGTYDVEWAGRDRIVLILLSGKLVPVAISGDTVQLGECGCTTPGNEVSYAKHEDGTSRCTSCGRIHIRPPGSGKKRANIPASVLDEAIKSGCAVVKP